MYSVGLRARFSNHIVVYLSFISILHQAESGKRADTGFKKEAWTAVDTAVQVLCPMLTHDQAENKVDIYKVKWKAWLELGQ